MKDELCRYIWLKGYVSADAESAADLVSAWISSFDCMKWIATDRGSHFSNALMTELTIEYKVQHHFVTTYSPWTNEMVCREVLRTRKALLSEWKLASQDWTACIQSILNHSPVQRLDARDKAQPNLYRTPLECFTGIKPSRPLLRALPMRT